jgi:hypothetical protein
LTWIKYDNSLLAASNSIGTNGRIPLGLSGKGDSDHAYYPSVIKDGSIYKMWYTGMPNASTGYCIYYATSPDGLTWTKYDNTIPSVSNTTSTNGRIPNGTAVSGIGDSTNAYNCSVILDNGIYKAWYTGYYNSYNIYCAEG